MAWFLRIAASLCQTRFLRRTLMGVPVSLTVLLGTVLSGAILLSKPASAQTSQVQFVPVEAGLQNVQTSTSHFVDLDGDGDKDLLITGDTTASDTLAPAAIAYENDGQGTFTEVEVGLTGVARGSLDYADIDGDGDLDLVLTGNDGNGPSSTIYENQGDTDGDGFPNFSSTGADLTGVVGSTSDFIDIDGDGDPDLIISGSKSGDPNNPQPSTKVYENDGDGNFSSIDNDLTDVAASSSAHGDIDGDEDVDFVLTGIEIIEIPIIGEQPVPTATVYENDGTGDFSDIEAGLTGVALGSSTFIDLEEDGDLDLVVTGATGDSFDDAQPSAAVYKNDGDGNFTEVEAGLTAVAGSASGSVDVDEDGDHDLLITGSTNADPDDPQPLTTMYVNDGQGNLTEIEEDSLANVAVGSIDFSDIEGDGDPDLILTGQNESEVPATTLYENNRPPAAVADSFSTPEDSTLAVSAPGVLGNDTDPEGGPLTASVVNGVSNGTLTLDGEGSFEYVPDTNFTGTDSFTYEATDELGAADTATATITVTPQNDPPMAVADSNQTSEGSVLTESAPGVLGNDTDPDDDILEVSKVNGSSGNVGTEITLPSGAQATLDADGAYTYDPNGAFESLTDGESETDSFDYTVADGNGGTDQTTVSITIDGVNDAPVAEADSFQTPEDSTLAVSAPGVLGNDTDPEGGPLTASVVNGVSNGTLTLDGEGSFEYVPDTNFTGTDSFTYEATDELGAADTATATISVESQTITLSVPLAAGWNLLSVPLQLENQRFGSVFPSCQSGFFFDAGSGYQSIGQSDPVPVGEGLWGNCTADTLAVTGQRADSTMIPVDAGWNIIGPLADTVEVNAITSDPPGIVQTSFFGFDPSSGYTTASALAPGRGYWVKAGQHGSLDLTGEGQRPAFAAAKRKGTTAAGTPRETIEVVVTDARGHQATLRLMRGAPTTQLKRYALPPPPPKKAFDVRFAEGRSAATVGGDRGGLRTVEVRGAVRPLTLRLVGAAAVPPVQVRQGRGPSARTMQLTPEQPSLTLREWEEPLRIGLQSAPDQFALRRSFPNPVSGRAIIEYAVPKQTRVTVAVYDVLGRRVATLVESKKEAGRYSVRLEVSQLSSGMYFYRMRAGAFRKTRQLTVVQ